MTPAEAREQLRGQLAEMGETILVRRYSGLGAARTRSEAQILARALGYQPRELVGTIVQGDIKVVALVDPNATVNAGYVSLASLLPLSSNDFVVIRGAERAIKGVDDNTRRLAGELFGLDIQVSGG